VYSGLPGVNSLFIEHKLALTIKEINLPEMLFNVQVLRAARK